MWLSQYFMAHPVRLSLWLKKFRKIFQVKSILPSKMASAFQGCKLSVFKWPKWGFNQTNIDRGFLDQLNMGRINLALVNFTGFLKKQIHSQCHNYPYGGRAVERRGQEPEGGLCAEYGHQVCRVSEMYMNVFAVQAQLPFLQTRARFHKIYAAKKILDQIGIFCYLQLKLQLQITNFIIRCG